MKDWKRKNRDQEDRELHKSTSNILQKKKWTSEESLEHLYRGVLASVFSVFTFKNK